MSYKDKNFRSAFAQFPFRSSLRLPMSLKPPQANQHEPVRVTCGNRECAQRKEDDVGTTTDAVSLRAMLDALPAMVMVVDEDVRILDYNQAAASLLPGGPDTFFMKRSGDAMHCLHSLETPQGCGHSVQCQRCVVRNSVQEAIRGATVARRRARLELRTSTEILEIYALVTATPITFEGQARVLLAIDNISDLTDIQSFLPICSVCKKIRPEKNTWLPLESYFKNYWDVDFSHSYCPSCQTAEQARLLQEFAEAGGCST